MKRLLPFSLCALLLVASCTTPGAEEIEGVDNPTVAIPGGGASWKPYYFLVFKNFVSFHPVSSDNIHNNDKKPDREILFVLDDYSAPDRKAIAVPDDEYVVIRKALGDTIKFCHTDAEPGGIAYINDFTNVSLISDRDYEGVPAGESLASIVDFTYTTCVPWIRLKHYNGKGEIDHYTPIYNTVTCKLSDLNLTDFNGCSQCGKVTFPSAPNPEQHFTIVFSGESRKVTSTFTIPPVLDDTDFDWGMYYY